MKNKNLLSISLFIIFLASFYCPAAGQEVPVGPVAAAAENITLDIKGMDILDVLKILAVKSGLNIVAGKNVTGKVTIYLRDVNVWEALEIVLVANNLAYEKQGNIINVMTDRDYELIYGDRFYDKKRAHMVKLKYARAQEVSKALIQVKTNIGKVIVDEGSNTLVLEDVPSSIFQMRQMIKKMDAPIQTRVFSLQYARAEDIEKKVSELVTKNLGTIKVDARTNKIFISDRPDQMVKLADMIAAFDQKDAQVMIEAKILEITLNNNFKMGIDWDFIAHKYFKMAQGLKLSLTQGTTIKVGTLVGGSASSVEGDYSALIEALREVGEVNTLSAPRIMALNNQESKILIGKKEPYSTKTSVASEQTTTTAESVTFVDLGVKLYVTPTINESGFITMKIKPEVSSKTDTYTTADKNTIPIISTTEAETTILVKDGATIVIAGLIKDTLDRKEYKIPFLGDIPFIGRLFSNDTDSKKKEEIVILLTPHLATGESTLDDDAARWNKRINAINVLKDPVDIADNARPKEQPKKFKAQPEPARKIVAEKGEREKVKGEREKIKEREKEKKGPEASPSENFPILRIVAQKLALEEAALAVTDEYDNYFLNMKSRIQQAVCRNSSDIKTKGSATASFIVISDGSLKGEPVVTNEDDEALGDILISGIKMSSPFAGFPESFNAQEDKFTVTIDVR